MNTPTIRCPNGHVAATGDQFCGRCGATLAAATAPTAPTGPAGTTVERTRALASHPELRARRGRWIAVVLAVGLIATGAGVFLATRNSNSTTQRAAAHPTARDTPHETTEQTAAPTTTVPANDADTVGSVDELVALLNARGVPCQTGLSHTASDIGNPQSRLGQALATSIKEYGNCLLTIGPAAGVGVFVWPTTTDRHAFAADLAAAVPPDACGGTVPALASATTFQAANWIIQAIDATRAEQIAGALPEAQRSTACNLLAVSG